MKRYIAFLRGVNISGKNKVPMAALREGFENAGFNEVRTYLNSGNVAFSEDEEKVGSLSKKIEAVIKNQFGFEIPVFVIAQEALENILRNAPGEPREGLEKIQDYNEAVFWSFSRKDYHKTNWWSKTASAEIGKKLTTRTAGTVRKIVGM